MSGKHAFFIGVLGAVLFVITSIAGGILIDDYNISTQLISETYAIDTKYGMILREFGIIPSGILLAVFCFLGPKFFQPSKLTSIGFFGMGIFYGVATVIVGVFPCDSGCNREFIDPSISQIIHNLIGFLTYIFVPVSLILIGIGLRKQQGNNGLSKLSILTGVLSSVGIYLLSSGEHPEYIGLYQRIIETLFVVWIISCAFVIKKS